MEDFAKQHYGVLLALLTAAVLVIQWFVLRGVRSNDSKLETILVCLFGDGKEAEGVLTRLRIIEHDHHRNHGEVTARGGGEELERLPVRGARPARAPR